MLQLRFSILNLLLDNAWFLGLHAVCDVTLTMRGRNWIDKACTLIVLRIGHQRRGNQRPSFAAINHTNEPFGGIVKEQKSTKREGKSTKREGKSTKKSSSHDERVQIRRPLGASTLMHGKGKKIRPKGQRLCTIDKAHLMARQASHIIQCSQSSAPNSWTISWTSASTSPQWTSLWSGRTVNGQVQTSGRTSPTMSLTV